MLPTPFKGPSPKPTRAQIKHAMVPKVRFIVYQREPDLVPEAT